MSSDHSHPSTHQSQLSNTPQPASVTPVRVSFPGPWQYCRTPSPTQSGNYSMRPICAPPADTLTIPPVDMHTAQSLSMVQGTFPNYTRWSLGLGGVVYEPYQWAADDFATAAQYHTSTPHGFGPTAQSFALPGQAQPPIYQGTCAPNVQTYAPTYQPWNPSGYPGPCHETYGQQGHGSVDAERHHCQYGDIFPPLPSRYAQQAHTGLVSEYLHSPGYRGFATSPALHDQPTHPGLGLSNSHARLPTTSPTPVSRGPVGSRYNEPAPSGQRGRVLLPRLRPSATYGPQRVCFGGDSDREYTGGDARRY